MAFPNNPMMSIMTGLTAGATDALKARETQQKAEQDKAETDRKAMLEDLKTFDALNVDRKTKLAMFKQKWPKVDLGQVEGEITEIQKTQQKVTNQVPVKKDFPVLGPTRPGEKLGTVNRVATKADGTPITAPLTTMQTVETPVTRMGLVPVNPFQDGSPKVTLANAQGENRLAAVNAQQGAMTDRTLIQQTGANWRETVKSGDRRHASNMTLRGREILARSGERRASIAANASNYRADRGYDGSVYRADQGLKGSMYATDQRSAAADARIAEMERQFDQREIRLAQSASGKNVALTAGQASTALTRAESDILDIQKELTWIAAEGKYTLKEEREIREAALIDQLEQATNDANFYREIVKNGGQTPNIVTPAQPAPVVQAKPAPAPAPAAKPPEGKRGLTGAPPAQAQPEAKPKPVKKPLAVDPAIADAFKAGVEAVKKSK